MSGEIWCMGIAQQYVIVTQESNKPEADDPHVTPAGTCRPVGLY